VKTTPFRPAFVLEQTLGHVTHTQNLKRRLGEEANLTPLWLDVPFQPPGWRYKLPPVSRNWSLRGSLAARAQLASCDLAAVDALFVHTLTVALFATPAYEQVPTVLSLDATPINFDSVGRHYGHRAGNRLIERLKLGLVKRAVSRARAYVTWSDWAKKSLVDDYGADPKCVAVIAPGADLSLFRRSAARRPGVPRILFVGGNFQRKGGDVLLEAFAERLRGRAELHIVTGDAVPVAEGVFVYKGLPPNSTELLRLFSEADVFALPTRADCLAVVLGEAMAASLPIVTTAVGAHPEAVRDGDNGLIVPPDDASALADALERLVEDAGLRETMGERGRVIAEERFDAQRNAIAVLDLMREVAGCAA
jgi:glycosyltransferase involved in cell wall biosynthesis